MITKYKKSIKLANSGYYYLKIQTVYKKDLTLLFFETQKPIIDYINDKLNPKTWCMDDDERYDLNKLMKLHNKNTHEVFKTAFILKNELWNHYNSFHGDYADYDLDFYSLDTFDNNVIENYDYWGKHVSDIFEDDENKSSYSNGYDDYDCNPVMYDSLDRGDFY